MIAVLKRGSLAACLWLVTSACFGHADQPPAPHDLWHSWNLEAWLLILYTASLALYGLGLRRLWRRAGRFRGVSAWQLCSFATGMLLLFIALISPVDALGEALASAHMLQHMLLIFAAPFLIMSAPLVVYLWAFPRAWRQRLGGESKRGWIAQPWQLLTQPTVAWAVHGIALWAWHAPSLYELALEKPLVHDLEHFSFFASSLLFWWVVFRRAARTAALALVFTTMLHSGVLGALMTFSSRPWYPAYQDTTLPWGVTPLEDLQLAGLLMWVPGGIGYLLAALTMVAVWLQRMEMQAAAPVESVKSASMAASKAR